MIGRYVEIVQYLCGPVGLPVASIHLLKVMVSVGTILKLLLSRYGIYLFNLAKHLQEVVHNNKEWGNLFCSAP
jgi:hypothetical protein